MLTESQLVWTWPAGSPCERHVGHENARPAGRCHELPRPAAADQQFAGRLAYASLVRRGAMAPPDPLTTKAPHPQAIHRC
jgi:hypothetical protein